MALPRRLSSLCVLITLSLVASLGASAFMLSAAEAAPVRTSPGQITDNPVSFYILGGNFSFGTGTTPVAVTLKHNDQPPECSNGIDDESGNVASQSATTVYPAGSGLDTLIDSPAETASTGCVNAADNSELIARSTIVPNPGSCAASANSPFCTGLDGLRGGGGGTRVASSDYFGDGTGTTTGQAKVNNQAVNGTNSPVGTISVPAANASLGASYSIQGQSGSGFYFNFLTKQQITVTAPVTGTSLVNGDGTVNITLGVDVKLLKSYDSSDFSFLGPQTPRAVTCSTSLSLTGLSTTTAGGVKYDTFAKNFSVALNPFSLNLFTQTLGEGGNLAAVCQGVNDAICSQHTTNPCATNGQVKLNLTTQTTSNTTGSSDSGTGMAGRPGQWRPVAAAQTSVNGAALSAPSSGDLTLNVKEGDLVRLDGDASYDPAQRPFTVDTLNQTAGAAPPYTAGSGTTDKSFVAQDAPLAGNSLTFQRAVQADLGPLLVGPNAQTQADTQTITVNVANVAPTASSTCTTGCAFRQEIGGFTANGGKPFTLSGSSFDPADPDTPAGRGYCWTQTGGSLTAPAPACSGSPSGNGKTLAITPPNTTGTATYSLVVTDKDGGASLASTVTINVVATAANTISGVVQTCIGSCSNPAGIPVKLYRDSLGLVASTTTAAGGGYSFPGLAAASDYRVQFGGSPSSMIPEWFDNAAVAGEGNALTPPLANVDATLYDTVLARTISGTINKTSGGTVANGTSVRLYDDTGFVSSTTTTSGAYSFTGLQPKSTYRVNIAKADATLAETWYNSAGNAYRGQDASLVNVSAGNQTAVNATIRDKIIGSTGMGNLAGKVTATTGGANIAGIQARVYDNATGKWIGTSTTNATGDYTFTNAFGSNVTGLPPANYRIWFWNATSVSPGAGQVFCSEWFDNIPGGQYQGSGRFASPVAVAANATTTQNADLAQGTLAVCPK